MPFLPAEYDEEDIYYLSNEVVHDWLPKLKCLRALSLENYAIMRLPDSINDLKHLTYLNLCDTKIEVLPESVGNLIQLQSLLLLDYRRFQKFPENIGNLIDLHHMDIRGTDSLIEMPLGMCKLKNLVMLSKFIVGKTDTMLKLYHLENFSQLRGELSILDLRNVTDADDARKASLGKIVGLDDLILKWTSDFSDSRNEHNIELQVLGWLKPHLNLKSLEIVSYGGKELSSWIGDPSFKHMSKLELRACKNCTSLPSLDRLPALKKLIVRGMHAVKAVGQEFFGLNGTFPSLVELVFEDMLNWEEWTCSTEIFPSLVELVIEECPKLRSSSLPSCQQLLIRDCGAMSTIVLTCFSRLESLEIERCSSLKCIAGGKIPTTLKSLKIKACENLESLHCTDNSHESSEVGEQASITACSSLKEFEVGDCTKLKSLPEGMLQYCTALESITIGSYEILKSFLNLESSLSRLESLEIYGIDGCETLPDMSLAIPNLKYLQIEDCPSIECIPDGGLPPNLSELIIWGCKNLTSLPNTMGLLESLRSLWISDCKNLKSLPKSMHSSRSLESLYIVCCPGIECIAADGSLPPNLANLELLECENLKSLPNTVCELTSLWELSLPNGNLMAGWNNLHSLTSLRTIRISKACPPPDVLLPSSVTRMEISDLENEESIPKELFQNLNSLQRLYIEKCRKLQFLPREAMPPSLGCLWIDKCPLLKRQRFEFKGDYWPLTRNIPCVEIDDDQV